MSSRVGLSALLITVTLLLGACAGAPPRAASTLAELRPGTARFVLLGEVHDNAIGHARRAAWLRQQIEAGWRPAIAMEQFDRESQPALDQALRECTDAACVIARAAPAKNAWQWPDYAPVIALALKYRLPLLAANLSREDAARVVREGYAAVLTPQIMQTYRLASPPPADLAQGQQDEVERGHCGLLPAAMLPAMARAQIARDVVMAQVVQSHPGPVVLLAGNGHVRRDLGVPRWLPAAALSVGFLETARDTTAYDFVERLPGQSRPDPCEALKARFAPR